MNGYQILGAIDSATSKEIVSQTGGVLQSIANIFKPSGGGPAPKTETAHTTPHAATTSPWVWAGVSAVLLGGLFLGLRR